jgi:hypothetical protein
MKGQNEQTSYTEEQAINITIENGYNGSEFETSTWKQRGCLKPNKTMDALISKLKTIYDHVEVTGAGKKRKYILKDKKNQVSERIFNYKGSVETEEDKIMKEYIFNNLLSYKSNFNKSYKGWAKLIGFIDTSTLPIEGMIKELKNSHYDFPVIYNPKEAVSIFLQTLNTRNNDILEKSFQRLEKEKRIKVIEVYNIRYANGKYKTITQMEYNTFIEYITKYLKQYNISYYTYAQSLTSLHKSKRMKEIINNVSQYIEDHFDIDYFFKSFKISITDLTIQKEVTKNEFDAAYIKRLIRLSEHRQEKNTYKNAIIFWKRFYLYNTLTLLKYLHVNEVNEKLFKLNKSYVEEIDNFALDLMIHKFESDVQREEERHSFGNN